jgi:hypothetical protein
MRIRTAVGVLALVAAVAVARGAGSAPDAVCQQAVARGAAKFTKAALKIGQRCALRTGAGSSCLDASEGPTAAALERAVARLAERVVDGCATSDLSAFAKRCPDASGPPLSAFELVHCVRDTHLDRLAGLLVVEFPTAALRTAAVGECTVPETCQCRCASPSGAFTAPLALDVF